MKIIPRAWRVAEIGDWVTEMLWGLWPIPRLLPRLDPIPGKEQASTLRTKNKGPTYLPRYVLVGSSRSVVWDFWTIVILV